MADRTHSPRRLIPLTVILVSPIVPGAAPAVHTAPGERLWTRVWKPPRATETDGVACQWAAQYRELGTDPYAGLDLLVTGGRVCVAGTAGASMALHAFER